MRNCAIHLALPVVNGIIDSTNPTAFGIAEILMFDDGTRATKEGHRVFRQVGIEPEAMRELIWKGMNGSTTISIPGHGPDLEGELIVTDGLITFNGITYMIQNEETEDYALAS